ncbi:hypothetical protein G7075_07440 [Phycicoccus sp. HDW14]|uniref:hypothetical protein n=1 Tax=Phycicoccus sp. HDW14 TaxID=2714941 RepID=UPI00140A17E5|nr:hypothetical protein [Phycicoccus sp. HDW14]QIM21004.1 hypothetical protein G7075_07440 [Phycicoccus sp. HDW14]
MPTVENPYAGQGPVPLDIGGDVGALVVTLPDDRPDLAALEVEIRPAGSSAARPHDHGQDHDGHDHGDGGHHHHSHPHGAFPHVGVVPRPTPAGTVSSLVYPAVTEGDYELCPVGTDEVVLTATVTGGRVTELDWPG